MQKITLGFSPCPNDTFIFDAWLHGKIDSEGLEVDLVLEDVEALNRRAENGELHVTKLSYHAFAYLTEQYQLLTSGSALGHGVGPLLVTAANINEKDLANSSIAIPGKLTTANFLLSLAFPLAVNKTEVLFSEIEDLVANGTFDTGLIIHENRFTYEQKGLRKIIDLGEYWENLTWLPIPLGGIVIQRNLPEDLKLKVNRLIRKSLEYAFENRENLPDFVKNHAQAMDESVMNQHIDLYVNEYSLDLGDKGKTAVQRLFDMAVEKKLIKEFTTPIWI
jgi:1,4-dihydroxy-6-naphthoate synthase